MNLLDLQAFVAVAETGSVSGAARHLGLPKSSISRRIAHLEDALGLSLLTRSGGRVGLTDTGRRLHERTAGSFRDIRDAERDLVDAQDEPAGTLRVSAPHGIGATPWLTHLLTGYCRTYPRVDVELIFSPGRVDLVREGLDIAIRPWLEDGSDLMTRRLGAVAAALYASRDYLAQHGVPKDASALASHACVSHAALVDDGSWRLRDPAGKEQTLPVRSVLTANDINIVLHAIVDGAGIGILPCLAAGRFEANGQLVEVLPGWQVVEGALWLVWPPSRHLSPLVRAFVDHAVSYAAEQGVLADLGQ